jgi:hypothetical protein
LGHKKLKFHHAHGFQQRCLGSLIFISTIIYQAGWYRFGSNIIYAKNIEGKVNEKA